MWLFPTHWTDKLEFRLLFIPCCLRLNYVEHCSLERSLTQIPYTLVSSGHLISLNCHELFSIIECQTLYLVRSIVSHDPFSNSELHFPRGGKYFLFYFCSVPQGNTKAFSCNYQTWEYWDFVSSSWLSPFHCFLWFFYVSIAPTDKHI